MATARYCEHCGMKHKPGECPMVSDPRRKSRGSGGRKGDSWCDSCYSELSPRKPRGGHTEKCPVHVRNLLTPKRNPAKPPVKIPAHNPTWRRTGRGRNLAGKVMVYWRCTTCQRVDQSEGPEPGSRCPEIRGR